MATCSYTSRACPGRLGSWSQLLNCPITQSILARRRTPQEDGLGLVAVGEAMKRGFVFALAFIVFFTTSVARAQNVTGIDVTEYGIYTADKKNSKRDSAGVLQSTPKKIHHAMTTTTVQAEPGVRFGFIYRVVGKPTGQTVQLRKVVIYPPEGVKSLQSSTRQSSRASDPSPHRRNRIFGLYL